MTSNIPTFRLNHLDIPNIHKFGIGFDSIFEDIHRLASVTGKDNYPPYNVIKIDDDHFFIELALAGIPRDALDIEVDQNQLTISTEKAESDEELEYLHKGISQRGFSRSFTLADHVVVKGADMIDGVLKISLERQLPEELKPRKIDISSAK
jgi:molecular chaperone IbpA|tara:strand:+ start:625 stop:1077 length:453 start_codon:yes stop_codon:yes gene_type:complete